MEELWIRPYRSKIHDFLTETEIDYLIAVSTPYLSDARKVQKEAVKEEQNVQSVSKTVQHWLDDVVFKENATYEYFEEETGYQIYQLMPLKNVNSYTVKDQILLKMSKRIEMATKTNVLSRFGSSSYQVMKLDNSSQCGEIYSEVVVFILTNDIWT